MTIESKHLEEIMTKHNRITNLQVVFVDIEKYSRRRTLTQTEVIDRFTSCLDKALTRTSKEFIEYAQANGINFQTDIITLPTGDGAAIVFSFDGLHNIHLFFAKSLLEEIHDANMSTPCEKYNEHGWCNCHPNFGIRIGISEGRGIVYKDINKNYNVAGGVINLAARVMGLADKDQIIFTKDAYQQIIDMVDDPNLVDRFVEFGGVNIKHDIKIEVYHYKGEGEPYINTNPPKDLDFLQRMDKATSTLSTLGFPTPNTFRDSDSNLIVGAIETMANVLSTFKQEPKPKPVIELTREKEE
jgi:class 3 adenylate cyclase